MVEILEFYPDKPKEGWKWMEGKDGKKSVGPIM
jgi:catechol-2,3-dioxygenase